MDDNRPETIVGSKSFTAVAVNCAAKAGEYIKMKLGTTGQPGFKYSRQDLVTEADKGAERLIRNLIATHFPHHAFLGEEGVEPGPEASAAALKQAIEAEYLWIVDPIDGTTNFVHGFPFFAVSIALARNGKVIVGVVYDPVKDELFVAERGKGAYVRGKRLKVSAEQTVGESLLAAGFSSDPAMLVLNAREVSELALKARNLRVCGSAALHLAYVAAGRLSGFWEHGLNAWDLAAGSLLVEEAGGRVTDMNGNPFDLRVRNVAASNGLIHDELLAALRDVKV